MCIPCFECMSTILNGDFENLVKDGRCMTREEFCLTKQLDGTCKLHGEAYRKELELTPKKQKSVEFCKRCCNSHGKVVGTAFVHAVALNEKPICPLLSEVFTNNGERLEKCVNKVLMTAEGLA